MGDQIRRQKVLITNFLILEIFLQVTWYSANRWYIVVKLLLKAKNPFNQWVDFCVKNVIKLTYVQVLFEKLSEYYKYPRTPLIKGRERGGNRTGEEGEGHWTGGESVSYLGDGRPYLELWWKINSTYTSYVGLYSFLRHARIVGNTHSCVLTQQHWQTMTILRHQQRNIEPLASRTDDAKFNQVNILLLLLWFARTRDKTQLLKSKMDQRGFDESSCIWQGIAFHTDA